MFACLFLPPSPVASASGGSSRDTSQELLRLAREFSPRVDEEAPGCVTLDLDGLERLFGDNRALGEQIRQAAADRGLLIHVAVATTRTAAVLLASARAGLSVVPAGEEAQALAPLPLATLATLGGDRGSRHQPPTTGLRPPFTGPRSLPPDHRPPIAGSRSPATGPRPQATGLALSTLQRWGVRTLGEFAALPPVALFERLGEQGVRWQRLARGEDVEPLVPEVVEEPFEASLSLDWPVEGIEPLSFVFSRLFDQLVTRLEREDRAVAVLHVALRLVTRAVDVRRFQLPAPMRDARVLRTLVLLDLEAHPVAAGIDAVTVRVDPTPDRTVQYSLLARPHPEPEQLSTLVARLSALVGDGRVGGALPADTHRPGAFRMGDGRGWVSTIHGVGTGFGPGVRTGTSRGIGRATRGGQLVLRAAEEPPVTPLSARGVHAYGEGTAPLALRRFRWPVPARVLVQDGRPVRVTTDRQGVSGGRVEACAGPWRTSGDWWRVPDARLEARPDGRPNLVGWDRDEWDVALGDGALYRIYRDRERDRWFVDGIVD